MIESIKSELEKVTALYRYFGNVKIIVVIFGVLLCVYNQKNATILGWTVFALLCVVFTILLIQHEKIISKKEYLETKLEIVTKDYLRSKGEWIDFKDTGEEFLSEASYLERDLDILGEKSLYQYLCVANTVEGKKKLAKYLTQRSHNLQGIKENENAINELIGKYDFRLRLEVLSGLSKKKCKDDTDEWYYAFLEYLKEDEKVEYARLKVCAMILPIILGITFGLAYLKIMSYEISMIVLLAQICIAYYTSYKNRKVIQKLSKFCLGIDNVIEMLQCIVEETFESSSLKNIQCELNYKNSLMIGIKELRKISDLFSVQKIVYVHIVLQMFLMYDVHCLRKLENWKKNYGSSFQKIYEIIGEMEALLSLSTIALDREVAFPEFSDSRTPVFEATDMYHPLIEREKVVSNTIKVDKGINIITGSNMSGKSTFLRTMGINMVLAYAGAPVCAKEMQISFMNLFTCMRVTDDVFFGRSSFYAEVLRIKTIVENSGKKEPMFVIIDEIFKGTNSDDRITGAKEIIKKLNKDYIILFVSTHDLELCSLIDEKELEGNNYHFLETYVNNEICFDYKIKNGKCKSKNAKYILKMAGLIE